MKADAEFLQTLLRQLVRINSVNPMLEPNGGGETEISAFIRQTLSHHGIPCTREEIAPGRFNVTGVVKGSGGGRSLMLNAHMDTVGVSGMKHPFAAEIRDGKLYGRGAYDMKASIAAIIMAGIMIQQSDIRPAGDLLLTFVADEEYESIGAAELVKHFKPDAAIVTEPTGLAICTAHRGFGIYEVVTQGKTAHGGNHTLGRDANLMTGPILTALGAHAAALTKHRSHRLCGSASMHVPLISGGRSLFVYSDSCRFNIERRTIPGDTQASVLDEFQSLLNRVKQEYPETEAEITEKLWRSPYEIPADAQICRTLSDASEAVTGTAPRRIGHTWWEDSAIFGEAGIPSVVFGPRGGGIHEDVEWVELDSVTLLAEILAQTAVQFCSRTTSAGSGG